jgi:cysteine desulfurase/selenocysteine lyase
VSVTKQVGGAKPAQALDAGQVRREFPIFAVKPHGRRLVYLDNAATTQKPSVVLDAVDAYYRESNSNVHRGVHYLSERATAAYEDARERVRAFIGARSVREVIFVRGTTEAINLAASSFGRQRLRPGDRIVLTAMEHHSNIVPWQIICRETGASIDVAPINDAGELEMPAFESLLTDKVRLVAIGHVSNALGTVNPVRELVAAAHERGIPVLVDGAQAVSHLPVDVRELDCDFYAFSSHKMYGPMGIGCLYGREELLDAMPPWQGGGDMIKSVTFTKTVYNDIPHRFEAGTPNVAGAVGLAAAIGFIEGIGRDAIAAHERALLEEATARLLQVPGLTIVGTAAEKAAVISFTLQGVHPHDIGTILDRQGIAVRTGHHCAQPVMERYGLSATARASFGVYNTREDIDALASGLGEVKKVFG